MNRFTSPRHDMIVVLHDNSIRFCRTSRRGVTCAMRLQFKDARTLGWFEKYQRAIDPR